MTILDPLLTDPLDNLARRVTSLEQRPQVYEPQSISPVPGSGGTPTTFPATGLWVRTDSATFQQLWIGRAPQLTGPALGIRVPWGTAGTASGEARLIVTTADGTATSSVGVLPAGALVNDALAFIHGLPLWREQVTVSLEARKTGGSDFVYVYEGPWWMTDQRGATTAGAWFYSSWPPSL